MADEDMNAIRIPLADVRQKLVELMREGQSELGLTDFLLLLREIYRDTRDEPRTLPTP
jgi:hypothetical protein